MKKRMFFLRAGAHTSACAEHDKAACVIAGKGATSASGECAPQASGIRAKTES